MSAALRIIADDHFTIPAATPVSLPAKSKRSRLRFITCGSVDDGKSTLIGRILYEAGAVFDDHLDALDRDSEKFGTTGRNRDYALLVDGLAAEREQGITIDVAYRYFSTPKRHFIVADTPGHEQYTRNMATGASTADLAILLVDARKGLLPQTRRHSFIVSMMGVRHVVVAINKMDLVGFDEARFHEIEASYREAAATLGFESITCIPVSAREGDNLITLSARMPWYRGTPLLSFLETVDVATQQNAETGFAMPVQWVNRPNAEFRGFSGTIAAGAIAVGERVSALPSGRESQVARIVTADGDLETAHRGQAVTLVLADEIDLSRGDVIALPLGGRMRDRARIRQEIVARLIVTGERPVEPGSVFLIKIGTAQAQATVTGIRHIVNIEHFTVEPATALALNAIGVVSLRFDRPLVVMDYAANPDLGGFILIDRLTNETGAFGFVEPESVSGRLEGGGLVPETAVSRAIIRLFGPAGSPERKAQITGVSWRLSSALILAGIAFFFSMSASLAAGVGLADIVFRPLIRVFHDALWRRFGTSRNVDLSLDGGGI